MMGFRQAPHAPNRLARRLQPVCLPIGGRPPQNPQTAAIPMKNHRFHEFGANPHLPEDVEKTQL
jgi:hypothetical protein